MNIDAADSRLKLTDYSAYELRKLTVAVIGAGALGSEVIRLIGMLGAGRVLLIDPDIIEATNYFHSSFLRNRDTIGRKKVEVFAHRCAEIFEDTEWIPFSHEIADIGFANLQKCKLLFSCTDSALARMETAYAARRLGIPMADAGLRGRAWWKGRVAWYPGNLEAACYVCQLSHVRRCELLSLSLAPSLSCAGDLSSAAEAALPSTPTMASVIAALQVDLGFRSCLGQVPNEARAWEVSLHPQTANMETVRIPRSDDCPWHDGALRYPLVALAEDQSLRSSLTERGRAEELVADWPLCVRSRCLRCGHVWQPMQRVARIRRVEKCPQCQRANPLPVEVIGCVRAKDRWAECTPEQIGFPRNHLFTFRPAGSA